MVQRVCACVCMYLVLYVYKSAYVRGSLFPPLQAIRREIIYARNWRVHLQTPFLIGQGCRSLHLSTLLCITLPSFSICLLYQTSHSLSLSLRVRPCNPRGLEGIVLPSTHPLLKSSPHPICWVICPSTGQHTFTRLAKELGIVSNVCTWYLLMYNLETWFLINSLFDVWGRIFHTSL